MLLKKFIENPDNPSYASDEELTKLAGKLKRVPAGLTAIRIAYVTDAKPGSNMVISGNKRLRVLKKAYGEDFDAPDEWFQDVTSMSEAERHEFIVTANVSDGHWDIEKLLAQYDTSELECLMDPEQLAKLIQDSSDTETADVEKFDDMDKGREKSFDFVAKIGDMQIPMTEEEYNKLEQLYHEYVVENQVGMGFFYTLMEK